MACRGSVNSKWALLLLSGSLAFSQLSVFKANTNLQSIAVRVTDSRGNHVQGLSAANFTLLENGKPQKIAFFGAEEQAASLAILVDSSVSMDSESKLEQVRNLLEPLIRGNRPEDEISLMQFDDKVGPLEHLTAEKRTRPPVLAPLLGSGGTSLYDALASALCHMRSARHARQVVVIITDGADQHSRLNLEQVIRLAGSSSAQVFAIGFFSKEEHEIFGDREKTVALATGHEIDNPLIVFERLAKESGAEAFFPSSNQDFKKALDRISAILEAQYTLAYYPENVTGLRKIDVKVNRSGVKVSARRTVGSDTSVEPVHFSATGCAVSATDHPYPWESRTSSIDGKTIYREDFSDPRSGWPTRAAKGRQVNATLNTHYVAKGYELSRSLATAAPEHGVVEGVIAAYGPWWENFRASASIESNWSRSARSGNLSDAAAGMIFNVGVAGYYALLLSSGERVGVAQKSLAYSLVRRNWYGPPTDVIPWTFVNTNGIRLAHKISVESNRGQITVWIDDVEVQRVKGQEYDAGQVGFGLYGRGRMVARDLVVEELR